MDTRRAPAPWLGVCVVVALALVIQACSRVSNSTTTAAEIAIAPSTSVTLPPTTTTSSSPTSTSAASTTSEAPGRETLIVQAVGDVNLDADVLGVFRTEGFGHAWSGLGSLFLEDDLTIVNLECSPSPDGPAEAKEFVFGCWPDAYPAAFDAGVDVMNLGNNHSQDHGKDAMLAGRAALDELGLNPVGVGVNAEEAGAPALFDIAGWRVAVIGFGGVVPWEGWLATDDRPGMRDGDTIETMVEAVRAADALADLVIVVIHWGVELDTEPRPEDRERAEAMIAAGADAIFGHHSHRLQPLEMVDGKPVAWSLGNFVWPRLSVAGSETGIARVVFDPDGSVESCLIPVEIVSDGHPELKGEPECGPVLAGG